MGLTRCYKGSAVADMGDRLATIRHAQGPWARELCVTWGPSPLPKKGAEPLPPHFRPMSIVAKRLDGSRWHLALGMEVGLSPGDFVLDGDPAPLPKKGAEPPPNFRQISTVHKRLDG